MAQTANSCAPRPSALSQLPKGVLKDALIKINDLYELDRDIAYLFPEMVYLNARFKNGSSMRLGFRRRAVLRADQGETEAEPMLAQQKPLYYWCIDSARWLE